MKKLFILLTILLSLGARANGVEELVGALHFDASHGIIREICWPPHRILTSLQMARLNEGLGGLLSTVVTKSKGNVTLAYRMTHVDRTGEDFITNLRFIYFPEMKDVSPSKYDGILRAKIAAFDGVMRRFGQRRGVSPLHVPWVKTASESLQTRTEFRIEIGDLKKLKLIDIEKVMVEFQRL